MFGHFESFEESNEKSDKVDDALHRNFRSGEKLPPEHGEVKDVTVNDNSGRALTLRTEAGGQEQLDRTLQSDQGHAVHSVRIRMYEEGRQVGLANLTLEVDKEFNNDTGHYDRITDCRMRINDILASENSRGRGIGTIMQEQAEVVARQSGAREIYGILEREQSRPFFEKNGYQFRHGVNGEELFKSYYFK